jgi:hypothetical protein
LRRYNMTAYNARLACIALPLAALHNPFDSSSLLGSGARRDVDSRIVPTANATPIETTPSGSLSPAERPGV